ncbi:hypothetical protein MHTCC0001_32570 [Flavobacteriaceae bacterium MHTCC 0001]
MSYSIKAISVDSEKVMKLWNSKNESHLQELITAFETKIKDLNKWFKAENIDASLIVRDMVYGEISFPKLNYVYGYVYEWICEKYGRNIEDHIQTADSLGISLEYLSEIDHSASAFIPIPVDSISDFPHIISIAHKNLEKKKSDFLNVELDYGNEEYQHDFTKIFDYVMKSGTDLVLLNY